MYTSPHLVDLSERIQVNGLCISIKYVNNFINKFKNDIQKLECTFFETLTVLALTFFKDSSIDIAILETGLGGRYDSVTASKPFLQLFTKISMDHNNILGDSIEAVSHEKAYAIQEKVPCISVNQDQKVKFILDKLAKEQETTINYISTEYREEYSSPLLGHHQQQNIMLAVSAAQTITTIDKQHITEGIETTTWPGRVEVVNKIPTVIFDVCHNDDSIIAFCNTIKSLNHIGQKILIISIQRTKLFENAINKINSIFSKIIFTQLNERMYTAKDLQTLFHEHNNTQIITKPNQAIVKTLNTINNSDMLAIIGSHYWGELINKNF